MQWNIKCVIDSRNVAVVERYFKCDYDGNVDGFDGVSIVEFGTDMKICDLKEFQSGWSIVIRMWNRGLNVIEKMGELHRKS